MIALTSLERFARRNAEARREPRCELCGEALSEEHKHVVDRADRRLLCTCPACFLAFDGNVDGRFRAVPERVRVAGGVTFEDLQALGVPVGLAFFFRPSHLGRWVGVFPSPAGPTEAELDEDAWSGLASIQDDIEALLVRCGRDRKVEAYVVPIDVCYELTALLRSGWRGIDGGEEGRRILDEFFARLGERAS